MKPARKVTIIAVIGGGDGCRFKAWNEGREKLEQSLACGVLGAAETLGGGFSKVTDWRLRFPFRDTKGITKGITEGHKRSKGSHRLPT